MHLTISSLVGWQRWQATRMCTHLEDGKVGAHAAVAAAAEADEGERRGLVLVAWRHKALRLKAVRVAEHMRQPVCKRRGCCHHMALHAAAPCMINF